MEKRITEILPADCGLSKVEAEGLDIVIYLKNIGAFYARDQLIKKIAGALRKRVLIRSDSASLLPQEESLKFIRSVIPIDAGLSEVRFNSDFCEVNIEALKPGLVIGKKGITLKQIIQKTGWAPIVLRTPTMESSTIKGIRKSMLRETQSRKRFLSSLGKKICTPVKKSDWVKVTALGGFREVGRTSILLQTPNDKILIDCGINAETTDPVRSFPYLNAMNLSPADLDGVIVTHAHLDHSGFIPYLFKYGFEGPVYCTPPTRDLMTLLQMDYLGILKKTVNASPPYSVKDIQKQLRRTITVDYGDVMDITPEIKLTLYNAGHILGSSMVHLHISEGLHNFVYTGDIKYGFTRLFDQANTAFPRVETMFMESTYGGRGDMMPNRFETDKMLYELIKKTLENKGKVLIPVFSVGRSQEIMLVLEEQAGRDPNFNYPVYLDGMILEASAIHTAYPEYLRRNIQRRILSNDSPFESKIFEIAKKNRKEIVEGGPAVILAPSGMLSGGPSVEYLKMMADNERNVMIFVGYQSVLSLGRKIQRGTREVPIIGENGKTQSLKINMGIETVDGFSGHSDRRQLMSFVRNIKPSPERVFTLHGDENKCEDLARSINRMFHIEARAPMNLDAIRLK